MKKYIKFFDVLTTFLISLIFFLTPLFFLGFTSKGFGFEKIILFEILLSFSLISFFVKSLIEKNLILRKTFLDWFWLILLTIYFLATFISVGIKDSLIGSFGNIAQGFIFLISITIFYYLLINTINFKRFRLWFISLSLSVLLIVFYSFFQILNILFFSFKFLEAIPFNPIGSTLSLVIFLVTFLPLLIINAFKTDKVIQCSEKKKYLLIKTFFILGVVFNLLLLFFLKIYISLGVWIVALFAIFLILILSLKKIGGEKFRNLAIPLLSLVAIIVFILSPSFEIFNPKLPIESSLSSGVSWNIARASLKDNLLLGSGPSTFYYNFSRFRGVEFNSFNSGDIWMERATGVIFNWLSDVGTLGTLGLLIIIFLILYNSFDLIRKNIKKDNVLKVLPLSLALFVIFLLSIFLPVGDSIYFIFFLLIVLVSSSFILFLSNKDLKENLVIINSLPVISFLSLMFLFFSLVFFIGGVKMFRADVYAHRSILSDSLDDKIKNMEKATDCFFYEDKYYYDLANYYSTKLVKDASENKSDLVWDNLNKATNLSNKALALSPNRVSNVKQIAGLYESIYLYSGEFSNFIENYYENYKFLEPNNFQPYFKLALIKLAKADLVDNEIEKNKYIDEAIDNYDKAQARKIDWSLPYYGKSMALEKKGDLSGAINELNKALDLEENNIDYLVGLGRLYFDKGILENKNKTDEDEFGMDQGEKEDVDDGLEHYDLSKKVQWNDNFEKAEEFFIKSLELNSEYDNSFYFLSLLYIKTNKALQAREYYNKLINNLDDGEVKNYIITEVGKYFD
ncbi:tetratricopeptide repeat protein [bacterium]|nr:tetratricopeptide repeat protein [bacterium]